MSSQYESLQLERRFIAGILKYPNRAKFIDINENDFVEIIHKTVYRIIKDSGEDDELDHQIVAHKIVQCGISFKHDIDIHEYLDSLSYTAITEDALHDIAKELRGLTIRRTLQAKLFALGGLVKNLNITPEELVVKFKEESIKNVEFKSYSAPELIFSNKDDLKNYKSPIFYDTHYLNFHSYFGGFRNKNIYTFYTNPKNKITTFVSDIAINMAVNGINVLYIDTNTSSTEFKMCRIHEECGVPYKDLELKQFDKIPKDKKDQIAKFIKKCETIKFYHKYIHNKDISAINDEILAWNCEGDKRIVIIDNIKANNIKNIEILADTAARLNYPIIIVCEKPNHIDDVYELQSISSSEFLWKQKTIEEINIEGLKFGSHKLIPIKYKYTGDNGRDVSALYKIDDKLERFFLNYDLTSGKIIEKGSIKGILDESSGRNNSQSGT